MVLWNSLYIAITKHKVMKQLIMLIMLFPIIAFSQLSHEQILEIDSTSQTALFKRAQFWIAQNYEFPKLVTKVIDLQDGLIMLSANFEYNCKLSTGFATHSGFIDYDINIYFKDSKINYIFSAFNHPTQGLLLDSQSNPNYFKYKSERRYYDKLWKDIIEQTKGFIEDVSGSLDLALKTPLESEKDW
jgi:hypothetical protein